MTYDAILILSFGGPEGMADVMPFLERVTAGRGVPRERLLEVAGHYQQFGGVSPINEQNRRLIAALRRELDRHGLNLPIYFGNRNWHPLLADTLRQMTAAGVRHALAFVTAAFSSWSSCRQYLDDIAAARAAAGPDAPRIDKLRAFYNHPGFIEPMTDRVRDALRSLPAESRDAARLIFTAHSIPVVMAETSRYVEQLEESCRLVAERVGRADWQLVYQSRSGPPHVPWLAPDVCNHLKQLKERQTGGAEKSPAVLLVPIGFISDHMEVVYDLDTEARQVAVELGITMVRAATVGAHPRFVQMIRERIEERLASGAPRLALGQYGPSHDVCPPDCCPPPPRGT